MNGPTKITDHVYWSPPAPPDRPSLCAVTDTQGTIWLDAGSSPAHSREFAQFLAKCGVPRPSHVILSHSHWDHVFGAAELGAHVVAHERTAAYLEQLAARDWSDDALDRRVAAGDEYQQYVDDIKVELPSPREVNVASAEIVFSDRLDFDLGEVRVHVRHVGGDHADDSTLMYVEPDGVLFLGDCLYEAPSGGYTADRLLPLIETVESFGATFFIEGHDGTVLSVAEIGAVMEEARASLL